MWVISTIFDKSIKAPKCPRPILSVLCDSKVGKIYVLDLFRKGSNNDLLTVKNRLKIFQKILTSSSVVLINDLKTHIDSLVGFGLDVQIPEQCNVYSRIEKITYEDSDDLNALTSRAKQSLKNVLVSSDKKPIWQLLNGKAGFIYSALQRKGFFDGIKNNYPYYVMESSSGRPSAIGYTIFNQSKDATIFPHDRSHTRFIQFDWIAADFRIGSLLSRDQAMLNSFLSSDPYSALAAHLGKERSECKKALLVATNALNPEGIALQYYKRFSEWICESIDELHTNKCLKSLLNRKFCYNSEDDQYEQDKRIINSVLQGSVVHAMQNAIWRIYHNFGNHLLTDRYDSIIMTSDESTLDFIIDKVSSIMVRPFDDLDVDESIKNISLPVAISIGTKWGDYTYVKDVR